MKTVRCENLESNEKGIFTSCFATQRDEFMLSRVVEERVVVFYCLQHISVEQSTAAADLAALATKVNAFPASNASDKSMVRRLVEEQAAPHGFVGNTTSIQYSRMDLNAPARVLRWRE